MANGSTICKILFGIFFGVLACICVIVAYQMDEITKETVTLGTFICGRKAQRLCSGDADECEKTLVYGYNLEGVGADDASSNVIIEKVADFETLCDSGIEDDYCTQLEAGFIFQYSNIVSLAFGGLAILLLLIPCTRKATCGMFITAAISAATAFTGFLIMLCYIICVVYIVNSIYVLYFVSMNLLI